MKHCYSSAIASFLACALVACLPLYAQSTQSSILGTVTDSSGAPVANATVTVRNEGTNFAREFKTDDSGDYRVSGLEAGFYEVKIAVCRVQNATARRASTWPARRSNASTPSWK